MAKIETIGAAQLAKVTGGILGFGGAGNRFPILRGLFQRAAGAGSAAGGAASGCPQQ